MKAVILLRVMIIVTLFGSMICHAQQKTPEVAQPTVETDGAVHFPEMTVPYSSLASPEAKKNFLDLIHGLASLDEGPDLKKLDWNKPADVAALRKQRDERLMRPGVEKLRAIFPVNIRSERVGGVPTDIIEPAAGFAARNARRVLINLHGGGFLGGAGLGGQMESIPIASLGSIKVIAVDYREGPEYRFPAASEDVAAVYRELLKSYKPKNIGIYGCSAGAVLTAQSMAWFQTHDLPTPGAIGMFGDGAMFPMAGDSDYFASVLGGLAPLPENPKRWAYSAYFDVPSLDNKDPLLAPAYSPSVLARFPPSLLISGTRDAELSPVVYTHAQLIKAGARADLHVWEGATHCIYGQPVVDPSVPETREVWDVIVKFFDKYLGS